MSYKRTRLRPHSRRSRRHAQFAFAVPFVMAQRMTRMMHPSPSARDRAELQRMVTEKALAFQQAWVAMASETMRLQYRVAQSWWDATLSVLDKGFAPVQRRAIRNARRLAR